MDSAGGWMPWQELPDARQHLPLIGLTAGDLGWRADDAAAARSLTIPPTYGPGTEVALMGSPA